MSLFCIGFVRHLGQYLLNDLMGFTTKGAGSAVDWFYFWIDRQSSVHVDQTCLVPHPPSCL